MINPLAALKDKATQFVQIKLEEVKVTTIEKVVKAMSYVAFLVVACLIACLIFFFVGFLIAEVFSELFKSRIYGYLTTAGVYTLILIIITISSKSIMRMFSNKFVRLLSAEKDDDED